KAARHGDGCRRAARRRASALPERRATSRGHSPQRSKRTREPAGPWWVLPGMARAPAPKRRLFVREWRQRPPHTAQSPARTLLLPDACPTSNPKTRQLLGWHGRNFFIQFEWPIPGGGLSLSMKSRGIERVSRTVPRGTERSRRRKRLRPRPCPCLDCSTIREHVEIAVIPFARRPACRRRALGSVERPAGSCLQRFVTANRSPSVISSTPAQGWSGLLRDGH